MTRRVFLVGTDTDCGKTTVACALLRAARAEGVRAVPFKPAASGVVDATGDPERLVAAAGIDGLGVSEVCPLRYLLAIAPGLAADGVEGFLAGRDVGAPGLAADGVEGFLAGRDGGAPGLAADGVEGFLAGRDVGALELACASLAELEGRYAPELTLIEGAGGLWVPMPGGSWLPAWISAMEAEVVVVGRLGLGTINHCLLCFAGLRALGLAPRGFILAQTHGEWDASQEHNERVIAASGGVPCLGVLGFRADPDAHSWLRGGVRALLG